MLTLQLCEQAYCLPQKQIIGYTINKDILTVSDIDNIEYNYKIEYLNCMETIREILDRLIIIKYMPICYYTVDIYKLTYNYTDEMIESIIDVIVLDMMIKDDLYKEHGTIFHINIGCGKDTDDTSKRIFRTFDQYKKIKIENGEL